MADTFYKLWEQRMIDRGVDIAKVRQAIKNFRCELPSWGFGDSGTRFQVFKKPGAAGTLEEKLQDAAQVNRYTGVTPTVAVHIPWDKCDDYEAIKKYAENLGVSIGAVNPNLFQDDDYMLGSLCNADASIRQKALDHMFECVDIMKKTGSKDLSLWLADGTNYPGQASFRERKHRLEDSLCQVEKAMPDGTRLLIEYKGFEPAFYATDLQDWGMSFTMAQKLGEKAQVLVDIGHHALGTNVEQIVSILLDEGKLGGFHFNNRKYADDDLIVGSIQPYELFLIFYELIAAERDAATAACAKNVAYMIDQSHAIEPKIPAMIRSVLNIQTAQAKALLVNSERLTKFQHANDVMAAENEIRSAYEIDVTPLLESVREEMGLAPDPMAAYLASGYYDTIKGRKQGKGWG